MPTKEDCWKMYIAWSNAEIRYREMGWTYNEHIARQAAAGWLERYETTYRDEWLDRASADIAKLRGD